MRINPAFGWLVSVVIGFFLCIAVVKDGDTVLWLLGAITVFWVFYAKVSKNASPPLPSSLTAPGKEPLTPTHADLHIALDAKSGRLWVLDERGKRHILERHEIREWAHHWTDQRKALGIYKIRNFMELRTNSIDNPTIRLRFNRYTDALNWKRNYEEGVTWQARLTTFLND